MLKLNSFLNECCFKGCSMGLKVQRNKKRLPGTRTLWYLGLFWIFSGSRFATPRYLGHCGVLTPPHLGHRRVSTPQHLGHRGVLIPWYIGNGGVLTHKVLKSLDSPVLRTPGSLDTPVLRTILDFQRVKICDSLVHRTLESFDSLVNETQGSLDSPVHRTPGSHFKMLITQPKSKKKKMALGHL